MPRQRDDIPKADVLAWMRQESKGYKAAAQHFARVLAGGDPSPELLERLRNRFARYGRELNIESGRPAGAAPRAQPPPAAPEPRDEYDGPDLATLDEVGFYEQLVRDLAADMRQMREEGHSNALAQTARQLVAARQALDEARKGAPKDDADELEGMPEEDYLVELEEEVQGLPDSYLEVYVRAYLDRKGLRLVVDEEAEAVA